MIYSLHGELIHTEPNLAVVECGGVGYACRTTMNTLKKNRRQRGSQAFYAAECPRGRDRSFRLR